MDYSDIVDKFIAACHYVAKQKLVRYSSGNLSERFDDGTMIVTDQDTCLEGIRREEIAQYEISTGKIGNNGKTSSEFVMHSEIYNNTCHNVILQFQSRFATTIACSNKLPSWLKMIKNFKVIPEISLYIKSIGYVPYDIPRSNKLIKNIIKSLTSERNDIIILENQGQIAVGNELYDTIRKAIFFEFACEIIVRNNYNVNYIEPLS